MIVSPNKGVFFVATALMCSASLYGAELSSPSSDPLARIFVGEPNRLTLPPGFPAAAEITLDEVGCAPEGQDHRIGGATLPTASASPDCPAEEKPEAGALVLSGRLPAVDENREKDRPLTSVSTTAEAH